MSKIIPLCIICNNRLMAVGIRTTSNDGKKHPNYKAINRRYCEICDKFFVVLLTVEE